MAGRPRRMLARVTSLEERAWDLMNAVSEAMPERYMDRDERMRDDPVWFAWYAAAREMSGALVWLKKLRVLLEQKVGEGQTPCEEAADKAPENAEGAGT